MANKGTLYLIPNTLGGESIDDIIPEIVRNEATSLRFFMVENIKSARRLLRKMDRQFPIDDSMFIEMNKRSTEQETMKVLHWLIEGKNVGVISDAGCACVADPGADIVSIYNICSAAITDISPVDGIMSPVYDEIADISRYYSFRHNRDMPRWGDIFSPYCKFARLETDEDRSTFCHVVNEYLDAFVGAVWKSNIDYNRAEERYDGQINYCKKGNTQKAFI